MEQNDNTFAYTYNAQEQAEVQKIRSKYLPREESKLDRLRVLDRRPGQKARAWAISLGVMGALVLGTGMSLIMSELGQLLGMLALPAGVFAGLIGLVLVALAYPLYNSILKKERERIAPEILRLTEELLR